MDTFGPCFPKIILFNKTRKCGYRRFRYFIDTCTKMTFPVENIVK